jgi:hypothetical protein
MTLHRVLSVALTALTATGAHASAGWRTVPSPTTDDLRAVRVAGDTLWLLGEDRIFRGTLEGAWSPPISLEGGRWTTMIDAGPDLVYGVTDAEQAIQSWGAGHVSTIGRLERCVSLDAVLTRFDGTFAAGCPYYSGLVFWHASDHETVEDGPLMAPRALTAIGRGDVLVLTLDGLWRARRREISALMLRDDPGSSRDSLLWATRDHIVTGSIEGEFSHARWDAATSRVDAWTTHRAPRDVSLRAIWGRGPDDLYAVGRAGVVLHFDGRAWTSMPVPTAADLSAVAGSSSGVWAAGAAGTLLRLDGR